MGFAAQFVNLVYSMTKPQPPDTTPTESRRRRRLRRQQQLEREYRKYFCDQTITILNKPQ